MTLQLTMRLFGKILQFRKSIRPGREIRQGIEFLRMRCSNVANVTKPIIDESQLLVSERRHAASTSVMPWPDELMSKGRQYRKQ
jgi:hypothetical protein